MNARTGKLSKREMATLNKALEILSNYTEWAEGDAENRGYEPEVDYGYVNACDAVAGLGEFIYECED